MRRVRPTPMSQLPERTYMAPRALESREAFLVRLRAAVAEGATDVRFGQYHFTHAACFEGDVWRVRRLECAPEDAEAYLAEHGIFMPEHAEVLSKPGEIVFEAASLDEVERALCDRAWPL